MHQAHEMAVVAKALGLKVMLGCMTETSCAVTAAAQLAPMADWADLDGNLLITNDPFDGLKIVDGKITCHRIARESESLRFRCFRERIFLRREVLFFP